MREGRARLHSIEEAELGPVEGLSILHLQCHFGRDSLTLAQRGAVVVGLDFSEPAILAARSLAAEVGLADRARFIQADLYDAPQAIGAPAAFDRVYVTWGAINWLPDIGRWAEIVAHFLKPGGLIIENSPIPDEPEIRRIDASALARKLGRVQLENVVLIGFASTVDGFPVSSEELRSQLAKDPREAVRTMNLRALEAGIRGR